MVLSGIAATLEWLLRGGLHAIAGTCYVWRMMRGASLTTHFEPLHKLRAHPGTPLGHAQLSASAQEILMPLAQC